MADETVRSKVHEAEARIDDEDDEGDETIRQRIEESLAGFLPEIFKRTVDAGWGTLSRTDTRKLLRFLKEVGLPRDVARYFLVQIDDTKNALLRVFAREVREFLEHTDLAEDMRRVLTSVSLEVSTRVRFVPNSDSPMGIKPEVDSKVRNAEGKVREPETPSRVPKPHSSEDEEE